MTIGNLQQIISSYLGPIFSPATPLTPASFVVNGIDYTMLALNNARRIAEKAHDFYYSKADLTLSIASTGSSIMNAEGKTGAGVDFTGSFSPNITTEPFVISGSYNGLALYTATISAVVWSLFYDGTAWIVSSTGFTPTNYFSGPLGTNNPAGAYEGNGSYTGTGTAAGESNFVGIKRIENVKLPLTNGDLIPIEFLTDDDWRSRMQREYGRQAWNPNLTSYQLGVGQNNPTCYQQGQNLFLVPASQFAFPVTATLSAIQWLPDYVQASDTDFFTEYAPDYLQWQGIIECNKLTKWFTQRREGSLDETNLQAEAQRAMESLLAWDLSISGGTTTPNPPLAPAPPAPQPQPQAA